MPTSERTTQRTFAGSHPWIKFELNLEKTGYPLWMNLGAIQSKCEHVANTMLPPHVAEELFNLYLAKGVRATTAIEGNTMTEEQVRARITSKPPLPKSQEYQGREIDNIIAACNGISNRLIDGHDCQLTVEDILQYNGLVLSGLPLEDGVVPGEIRRHSVGVGRYRGAPAEDCEYLLGRLCKWLNTELCSPDDQHKIAFGVLRAMMAHLYIAWIHPFGDGNGRTARLLEFHLLLSSGVPAVSAHLLSNHYNQTRPEYYRHLDVARHSVAAFIEYAAQGMVDRLDSQIKRIRKHQYAVTWKDFVYEKFRGRDTPAATRQRKLALALGARIAPVPIADIKKLNAELAYEYATKTPKTVMRDINVLRTLGLALRGKSKVSPTRYVLQGFLPGRREKDKWL